MSSTTNPAHGNAQAETTEEKLILVKDTSFTPTSVTVRLSDWTPAKMYDALTEAVESELADRGETLDDNQFTDGMTLGTAEVNLATKTIESVSLSI